MLLIILFLLTLMVHIWAKPHPISFDGSMFSLTLAVYHNNVDLEAYFHTLGLPL